MATVVGADESASARSAPIRDNRVSSSGPLRCGVGDRFGWRDAVNSGSVKSGKLDSRYPWRFDVRRE
jgi:hypothetical protein